MISIFFLNAIHFGGWKWVGAGYGKRVAKETEKTWNRRLTQMDADEEEKTFIHEEHPAVIARSDATRQSGSSETEKKILATEVTESTGAGN
jgi:hypothetical protein